MENEEYESKDVICLLLDMFGGERNYFVKEDFYEKYYWAHNFFDILTNYQKCYEVLQKDTNICPLKPEFAEWSSFAFKTYNELVYGYNPEDEQEEFEDDNIIPVDDLDFNISAAEV